MSQVPPNNGRSAVINLEDLCLRDDSSRTGMESQRPLSSRSKVSDTNLPAFSVRGSAMSSTRAAESYKPSSTVKVNQSMEPDVKSTRSQVQSQKPSTAVRSGDSYLPSFRSKDFTKMAESIEPATIAKATSSQIPSSPTSKAPSSTIQASERQQSRTTKLPAGGHLQTKRMAELRGEPKALLAERGSSVQSSSPLRTSWATLAPDSSRNSTEYYEIGHMDRTVVEGLISPTVYNDFEVSQKSTYKPEYPAPSGMRSMAPPSVKSILVGVKDFTMAARQTVYNELPAAEKAKQDDWVLSQIALQGACPEKFAWERKDDGYRCKGGNHFISDELLAEGKGGLFVVIDPEDTSDRVGPYYPDPRDKDDFKYAGELPVPRGHWMWLGTGREATAAKAADQEKRRLRQEQIDRYNAGLITLSGIPQGPLPFSQRIGPQGGSGF